MNLRRLGTRFETLAARHLEARGWTILDRNWHFGHRELDLVAGRGDVVAFVEVKGRRGAGYGHPLEAITWKKRREVEVAARAWLREHPQPGRTIRLDAISVVAERGGRPSIEHVEDAWRIAW